MVLLFNGKFIRNAIRNEEEEEITTAFEHLIKVNVLVPHFLTETQASEPCLGHHKADQANQMVMGLSRQKTYSGVGGGVLVLTTTGSYRLPASRPSPNRPSNSRTVRDRLWCSHSVWVEVTSVCRIKGLSLGIPYFHHGLRRPRVSFLAHWGWGLYL